MKTLFEAASTVVDEIESYQSQGGVDLIGIPTSFEELDYVTGGFRRDAYYVIGGRSGLGKSSIALSTALWQARKGINVWFTSLEMSAEMIALRLLSAATGINSMALERGRYPNDKVELVRKAKQEMAELSIIIDDTSTTTTELENNLQEYTQSKDVDILYADYTSLFRDSFTSSFEKESFVADKLRGLARDMDIPTVGLVQLNRNSLQRENSRPIISDIRNSGQHEFHAHCVMFIHRPHIESVMVNGEEPAQIEDAEIIVAKNRQGPSGMTLEVAFEPRKMNWRDKGTSIVPPPNIVR